MLNFNLKKSVIYQPLLLEKLFFFGLMKKIKKILILVFLICFVIFLYGLLFNIHEAILSKKLLGLSMIFFSLYMTTSYFESFFNWKLKKPKITANIKEILNNPQKHNLADVLNFEVAKVILEATNLAKKKKFYSIDSTVIFYCLLKNHPEFNFVFNRVLLNRKDIIKLLERNFEVQKKEQTINLINFSKDFEQVLLKSIEIAEKRGNEKVNLGDFLIGLAHHNLIFKNILIQSQLKLKDIEGLIFWKERLELRIKEMNQWWEYKNLVQNEGMAKEWTSGFTNTLDLFSTNLTERIKQQGLPRIVGHAEEINHVERVLANPESNNVLLTGEPGTGRKSIIEAIIVKSLEGRSMPEINHKKFKELNLTSLLTQMENKEKIEFVLDKIFTEVVEAGNIILIIDQFHNFIETEDRAGSIDISGILSNYLKNPRFQLIAITNFSGFHKNIEQSAIAQFFDKVEVSEISEEQTLKILENASILWEAKYNIFVSYPSLRNIIEYTKRYLPNLSFPEKALDLLSESVIYIVDKREKILLAKHVAQVFSEKTQIPIGEVQNKEKEILIHLEELIHQRIINQEEAVKEISAALRRSRSEITIKKGPLGGFLFLGPTGVGKTETAKALAQIYFGSEDKMIRLDMSEFQNTKDIDRLIGSREQEGFLTTQVRENPFSLILLDEIEKGHPNILNLFLQILDEGFLTDGEGRKVYFKDSIIIATSNAGYEIILNALKNKEDWGGVKQKLLDYVFEKAIFRPEFINRFDDVVVFQPLSKKHLLAISELMLKKLKKNLEEKDIDFIITQDLKERVVELGYNPVFGAREMRRVIQDRIENVLASALLSNELKAGNRIMMLPDFSLKIE
ncbi:MAG: ATP-dependent Clp protease ATP-binding subunit [Patescibacteria group bacterium]